MTGDNSVPRSIQHMSQQRIELNGFQVSFSSPTFTANVRDMSESEEIQPLREEWGDSWFFYWEEGKVYGLPRTPNAGLPFGQPSTLRCDEHLKLLAARVADILPGKFPKYEAFRLRPFTFLGQKDELVDAISSTIKGLPPLLSYFKIRPKFQLEAKLVEFRDGETSMGLFMDVGMRWEILAPLDELVRAHVDLMDLYVVRRETEPDQRRLVGRIDRIEGTTVFLSEAFDEVSSVDVSKVWLEGSKAAFARCLKTILGARYQEFDAERDHQEARFFTGPAMDGLLNTMGGFLRKASPMQLTNGLQCTVGARIVVANASDYKSVVPVSPVEYCFDAARTKRASHPWTGIEKYGPFSRETFAKKSPRILVVFPDTVQGAVETFLRSFRDGIAIADPNGRSYYSSGFGATFGLVNPEFALCRVPWLENAKRDPAGSYRRELEELLRNSDALPDAALVVVLDEHSQLPETHDPYLHAKALLLMAGIPVQEARLSTIAKPHESLQFICQNLSIALYAKLNGTPWTVDHDLTINDELVIGMGTIEVSGSRFTGRQRYVGITTVFRGDGNYLLAHSSKECTYDEYPRVLQSTTTNILREIKERNGWRAGDTVRVVFHAFKPLRRSEIAEITSGCVREVGSEQNIEFAFVTISEDHPFKALDKAQPGIWVKRRGSQVRKAIYVPERGTIIQLGRYTRLLCANGPSLVKRPNSPLPAPLLVHLHKESTFKDQTYLSEQALKFTALSWRSTLPASRPVTVYYSELIASLLARLRAVPDWSPAMLNIKLRTSRWFL